MISGDLSGMVWARGKLPSLTGRSCWGARRFFLVPSAIICFSFGDLYCVPYYQSVSHSSLSLFFRAACRLIFRGRSRLIGVSARSMHDHSIYPCVVPWCGSHTLDCFYFQLTFTPS